MTRFGPPAPGGVPPLGGNRDVIVVGGSSGALGAVRALLAGLPADLPASVFVAIHRTAELPNLLPAVLSAAGPLPAAEAREGERIERGRVYVPANDRHLLVSADHVHARRGPRENRTRPAIDPLFRSAAVSCSTRVIGVVLSGLLNDGAAGLLAVKRCGGIAVVQDPADAQFGDMPRSAAASVAVDHVRPAAELAELLVGLVAQRRPPPVEAPEATRIEAMIAAQELHMMIDAPDKLGELSPFTCPDCHGAMREIRENGLVRYRCHTGHAFTLEALGLTHAESWERTLYAAQRAQQEQQMLVRRMAEEARLRGNPRWAEELETRAADYENGAETIRRMLATGALSERATG